jgi:hypothetical protein
MQQVAEDDCSNVIAEDDATFAQASQFADVVELVRSIRVFPRVAPRSGAESMRSQLIALIRCI